MPKEQWRRVKVSGSLRGRRSKEIAQSNTWFSLGSEADFESQQDVMVIEIPQNGEIFGRRKNGEGKGLYSAVHQRRVNRECTDIKERGQGGFI